MNGSSSYTFDYGGAGDDSSSHHHHILYSSSGGGAAARLSSSSGGPSSSKYNPQQQATMFLVPPIMQQQQQQHNHQIASYSLSIPAQPQVYGNSFPLHFAATGGTTNNNHHNGNSSAQQVRHQAPPLDDFLSLLSDPDAFTATEDANVVSSSTTVIPPQNEAWLDEIQLKVPSISLDPMSGNSIVQRLREKMDDVQTRYIPCVDFLVNCQQELRKGLEVATNSRRRMTPHQFYMVYVDPLPGKFFSKNQFLVDNDFLNDAFQGLEKLRMDSRKAERQGLEAVKSNFLGGMKDGESWGLRRWLAKHGSALHTCTDLECILHACQKLDRDAPSTKKLSEILRPMAKTVLQKLQKEIPASYQQHSTAHPYLPFFHRLESAMRGMSNFDPEDDDVICLDDDEDDNDEVIEVDVKPQPAPSAAKRPREQQQDNSECKLPANKRMFLDDDAAASSSGESADEGSVVEIIDIIKPSGGKDDAIKGDWTCSSCSMVNSGTSSNCLACGEENLFKDIFSGFDDFMNDHKVAGTPASFESGFLQQDSRCASPQQQQQQQQQQQPLWPVPLDQPEFVQASANLIADNLDKLADAVQDPVHPFSRLPRANSFWNGTSYAEAIRLFSTLLRKPEALHFLDPIDEDKLLQAGNPPYSQVIKHPLCFREIVASLLGDDLVFGITTSSGRLYDAGLKNWNMWAGKDLLQAIDLVFLNSHAYGKALNLGRSPHRSLTNKVRKCLWNGINEIMGSVDAHKRKQCFPTRRSETSGFVVHKAQAH